MFTGASVVKEFEVLATSLTIRPSPFDQIILQNNPEILYHSMRELPVELWAEIFEFAIEDSPLQDPVYDPRHQRSAKTNQIPWNSHSPPHKHGGSIDLSSNAMSPPDSRSRQDVALGTKLAIASTSSQWRKIGLPYLFRTVIFVSLRQLQVFTGLVRGSRYRYVAGPHNIRLLLEGKGTGYGSLIRRLETEIDLGKDPSDHVIYADILSDLLKCCPYLRIYVNRNPQSGIPTPSPIIDALSKASIPETEYISWYKNALANDDINTARAIERLEWSGREGLVVGDLTYLLRSTPYLRKLILGPVFLCSTRLSDTLSNPMIPLLYLQSLHIDLTSVHRAFIRYTRRWILPSLVHLQVLVDSAPWQADLLFLLDAVGMGLQSLHLRVSQHTSMLTEHWVEILVRCPNLSSLVFNVASMPVIPSDILLPNLEIVGLEGCLPDFRATNEYDRPESDRREQLTEHLGSLAARRGTIRTIRMMDDEFHWISGKNAEGSGTMGWEIPRRRKLTREFNTWKELKMTLKLSGIALTDCDGMPIG